MDIVVTPGDITQIETGALITSLSPDGLWFGGIDGAIQLVAGDHFHRQAAGRRLSHGQVIYAPGPLYAFRSVIFVADHLKGSLRPLVRAALAEADWRKFDEVTVVPLRTDHTVDAMLRDRAPQELVRGIHDFATYKFKPSVQRLRIVINNDPSLEQTFRDQIEALSWPN